MNGVSFSKLKDLHSGHKNRKVLVWNPNQIDGMYHGCKTGTKVPKVQHAKAADMGLEKQWSINHVRLKGKPRKKTKGNAGKRRERRFSPHGKSTLLAARVT